MSIDNSALLDNLHRIHSTELGVLRIRKSLGLQNIDVIDWCKLCVIDKNSKFTRRGKNWYVATEFCTITINAMSFTIITEHK